MTARILHLLSAFLWRTLAPWRRWRLRREARRVFRAMSAEGVTELRDEVAGLAGISTDFVLTGDENAERLERGVSAAEIAADIWSTATRSLTSVGRIAEDHATLPERADLIIADNVSEGCGTVAIPKPPPACVLTGEVEIHATDITWDDGTVQRIKETRHLAHIIWRDGRKSDPHAANVTLETTNNGWIARRWAVVDGESKMVEEKRLELE